jgi:hypothetical protein
VPLELAAEICAAYIRCMVLRSCRGKPLNAPAAFIHFSKEQGICTKEQGI